MQFLLLAYDGTDPEAPDERMNARQEHLTKIAVMKKRGEFLFGGAILDDDGKMTGSAIVYEFPDRASLDESLKGEPYITSGVWKQIEIKTIRLADII